MEGALVLASRIVVMFLETARSKRVHARIRAQLRATTLECLMKFGLRLAGRERSLIVGDMFSL